MEIEYYRIKRCEKKMRMLLIHKKSRSDSCVAKRLPKLPKLAGNGQGSFNSKHKKIILKHPPSIPWSIRKMLARICSILTSIPSISSKKSKQFSKHKLSNARMLPSNAQMLASILSINKHLPSIPSMQKDNLNPRFLMMRTK